MPMIDHHSLPAAMAPKPVPLPINTGGAHESRCRSSLTSISLEFEASSSYLWANYWCDDVSCQAKMCIDREASAWIFDPRWSAQVTFPKPTAAERPRTQQIELHGRYQRYRHLRCPIVMRFQTGLRS